jgi:hypothetical protein
MQKIHPLVPPIAAILLSAFTLLGYQAGKRATCAHNQYITITQNR